MHQRCVCRCSRAISCRRFISAAPTPPRRWRREHGDSADLAPVVEIEAARADGRVAVEDEHVHAERVAVVELELARDALLVDEHRLANVPNAREVGGEVGVADEQGCSQQQPQPCRGP